MGMLLLLLLVGLMILVTFVTWLVAGWFLEIFVAVAAAAVVSFVVENGLVWIVD